MRCIQSERFASFPTWHRAQQMALVRRMSKELMIHIDKDRLLMSFFLPRLSLEMRRMDGSQKSRFSLVCRWIRASATRVSFDKWIISIASSVGSLVRPFYLSRYSRSCSTCVTYIGHRLIVMFDLVSIRSSCRWFFRHRPWLSSLLRRCSCSVSPVHDGVRHTTVASKGSSIIGMGVLTCLCSWWFRSFATKRFFSLIWEDKHRRSILI